jgi:hypothetical protein
MSATTATHRSAPPPLLKRLVIDYPLVAFFVVAFVEGWIVLLPTVLFKSGFGLILIALPAPAVMLFIPAAMAGPTLAAFVVGCNNQPPRNLWIAVRSYFATHGDPGHTTRKGDSR